MPKLDEIMPLPEKNEAVTAFLKTRRSNLAKLMGDPGPSEDQLSEFLAIAARVPDHRKLAPWRFMIFKGDARSNFGQHIGAAFMKQNPNAPQDRAIFEGARFMRAPVVVGVISSPVKCARGTPKWEQELSSGIVCYNLMLATQAAGFGAQWLTEWYAYDAQVNQALGLSEGERVAGYVYIGTPSAPSQERVRPQLDEKLSYWGEKGI